jgi:hypothetical protein
MFMEERISGWLAKVPGYTGYRSKEDQRDEDKQIRVAISGELNAVVDQLTRTGADLAAKREFDQISAIEKILADTRHLADRIRNASYGYGGIFTEQSVDETAIDQLRLFDIALQREVGSLGTLAANASDADGIATYRNRLIALGSLFDSRSSVVDQGRPTTDQKTLALLQKPAKATPSPLLNVAVGDALSVLGDNFTADATITLVYNEARLKLIRISGDKQSGERWLLGSSSTEVWPSADLVERKPVVSGSTSLVPVSGTGSPVPAKMSVEGPQGSDSNVPVTYELAQTDDSEISLEINVGGEVRSFAGKILKDIDVEIYGPVGTSS